jgi:betaine-aldehyde dehydrogenase
MRRLANFIDGKQTEPRGGGYLTLVNPATGAPFAESPHSDGDDVAAAVSAAQRAFTSWRRTTPSQRSRILLQIADALEARAAEIVALKSENTSKIVSVTMYEELPPMVD